MVFWIFKNKKCAEQIKSRFYDFKPNQNEFPFWLLYLRIVSSIDCLTFDSDSHTHNYNIINESTAKAVKQYLNDSKEKQISLNYNWINILLSNLPQQITINIDPSIKIIHDFFNILTMDNQIFQSDYINNMKNSIIFNSTYEITNLLLKNQFSFLLESNILDNKFQTFFLSFPSKYILQKIEESVFDIYADILNYESTQKLQIMLRDTSNFDMNIKNIQRLISDEENAIYLNNKFYSVRQNN